MHALHGAGCASFNAALAADAELILLLGAALGTRGTALKAHAAYSLHVWTDVKQMTP